MNTHLVKLFEKYNISDKNKYEINQFFLLLPDNKKQNLLNNFEKLVFKLSEIEETIEVERNILIGNEVENIKNLILNGRINKEKEKLRKELLGLHK